MTQNEIEELISLREQVSKLQQRQDFQQTRLARWAVGFLGIFFNIDRDHLYTRQSRPRRIWCGNDVYVYRFGVWQFGTARRFSVVSPKIKDGSAVLALRHAGLVVGAEASRRPAEASDTVGRRRRGGGNVEPPRRIGRLTFQTNVPDGNGRLSDLRAALTGARMLIKLLLGFDERINRAEIRLARSR